MGPFHNEQWCCMSEEASVSAVGPCQAKTSRILRFLSVSIGVVRAVLRVSVGLGSSMGLCNFH